MSNYWRGFFFTLLKKIIDYKSFTKLLEMFSKNVAPGERGRRMRTGFQRRAGSTRDLSLRREATCLVSRGRVYSGPESKSPWQFQGWMAWKWASV